MILQEQETLRIKITGLGIRKGPAIKVKDSSIIAHPVIKNMMIEEAKNNNLPYQLEVLEQGGTDSVPFMLLGEECLQVYYPYL